MNPKRPSYMEIGDDTKHPLCHIDDVLLSGCKKKCIKNILHVPTITKNLVAIKERLRGRSNKCVCFIKDLNVHKKLVILDDKMINSAMFADEQN